MTENALLFLQIPPSAPNPGNLVIATVHVHRYTMWPMGQTERYRARKNKSREFPSTYFFFDPKFICATTFYWICRLWWSTTLAESAIRLKQERKWSNRYRPAARHHFHLRGWTSKRAGGIPCCRSYIRAYSQWLALAVGTNSWTWAHHAKRTAQHKGAHTPLGKR